MKLKVNESFTNPKETNPNELVNTVLGWYDFDTNYIDDGGQRRTAEKKNQNTLEWFNEHPLELKQKAYKIMLSKVHSSDKAKVQNTFGKLISEVFATPNTNELKEMKNIKETIKSIIREESEYETFFRKALDKAGKGIADMSDDEKKAFFNKIDTAWTGKGEKNEGNTFGANRAKAIAKGDDSFKVDGDVFKVTGVDAEDKENAEKFSNESIVNEQSEPLELKGIKINKKSPITFVLEVSFVINGEVVVSYLTTGTPQDAQKLKSKIEKAFKAGKVLSPSGIGYYAYNESVMNEAVDFKDGKYRFYSKDGVGYLTYDGKVLSDGDYDFEGGNAYWMSHSSWGGQKAFKTGKDVIAYFKSKKITTEAVNEEKYTVIDPKGNQMGASDKGQAVAIAKKKGGEKEGYFVVSNKNALKARRALEKFKGDFKNPKLKDMMADLFYESVNEDFQPVILKLGNPKLLKVGEKITINTDGKKKEYKVVKSNGNGDFVLHPVNESVESVNEATLEQGTKLRYDKNSNVVDYVVDKKYTGRDGFPKYILKVVKSNTKNIKVGSTIEYDDARLTGLIRNRVMSFVKSESVDEAKYNFGKDDAPGEWVAYLSMTRGKKLLKTFDTARGAKMFLSKNVDKLLGGANVESVGIMTKKQWDEREAKYAIEGVVNEGKFEPNFAKKIEALIKKELGVSNLEAIGPRTGRVMNRQDYYFHIPNPTHGIVVSKKWWGEPYPDEYYVSLTNRLGQSQQETEVDHIKDENVVLKTVSAIAKKYKKQLTYAAMSETKSVNELKKLPSGNFSIKVGYPTFADYEKKAKVGDTILKYDKRGGMIKTFVNGSELDKNAEKYLDTVNNITSGIVYLSKKGMKGVAQVPDYEKKEVGVLVLEAKSVSEAISDKDLPNWLFDDPIDFEDWYEGGMELANNKGKLAPFSSSDEKKLFQLVGMWQDAEGDYQFGRGDLGTGKTTGARSASYSAQDLIKKFLTQKGKVVKNEGNTFGAERAKAIAKGDDSFKVDGEPFKVTGVDAKDKENAKKFTSENELPKATIPAAVQAKLDMAIEKIKDTKLTYNQKLSLIGKVMDGLGVDKGEFNKMASKLKGTMESVITEQLVPVDKKAVDAFFDKKPFEGKNLNSDGKVLKTVGVGSQEMFIHTPNGVKFVGKITGQYAQSVVQYVNKNFKGDLTETISEGNAFGMAVSAAKKEGLKEFEFNGKMYKVKTGSYEKNEAAKKPVVLSGFTLVPEKKK